MFASAGQFKVVRVYDGDTVKAIGKEASEHETNKAFERYCQMQGERPYDIALVVKAKSFPNTSPIPIKDGQIPQASEITR